MVNVYVNKLTLIHTSGKNISSQQMDSTRGPFIRLYFITRIITGVTPIIRHELQELILSLSGINAFISNQKFNNRVNKIFPYGCGSGCIFNPTPIRFHAFIVMMAIITWAVFSSPHKATAFSYKVSLKPC